MAVEAPPVWGSQWRSSQTFIVITATASLFSEAFLFAFAVPILPYMLETRIHLDPSQTQRLTTTLLTTSGLVSLVAAPVIAHFADKTPSRKIPTLLSLTTCVVGILFVACSTSVPVLMLGEILQAISGSAMWIVGFATLVDNVSTENKGTVLASSMSIVGTGIFAGPMISGTLLELVGYWPAWFAPVLLLVLNFIARLVMIEATPAAKGGNDDTTTEAGETSGLLGAAGEEGYQAAKSDATSNAGSSTSGFYWIMFSHPQSLAGLMQTLVLSMILAGFDATLPLHLRDVFNWGSLPTGMVFLGLQAPSALLGPLVGRVRDRVGLRYPTTIGWGMMAPLLWCLAVPGAGFKLAGGGETDKVIFISAIVGIGVGFALIRGAGAFQMIVVMNELQAENPNIFGPYGGNSRLSALSEVFFNMGLMLGPLLAGGLSEALGYYYMNCTLAIICLAVAVSSFAHLTAAPRSSEAESV